LLKNYTYFFRATSTGTLLFISSWALFTIPMYPSFKWIYSFINIFFADVPLSMISIFVITPIVRSPFLSHYLANFNPSEIAKSWLAGITHNIIVFGSLQYLHKLKITLLPSQLWFFIHLSDLLHRFSWFPASRLWLDLDNRSSIFSTWSDHLLSDLLFQLRRQSLFIYSFSPMRN